MQFFTYVISVKSLINFLKMTLQSLTRTKFWVTNYLYVHFTFLFFEKVTRIWSNMRERLYKTVLPIDRGKMVFYVNFQQQLPSTNIVLELCFCTYVVCAESLVQFLKIVPRTRGMNWVTNPPNRVNMLFYNLQMGILLSSFTSINIYVCHVIFVFLFFHTTIDSIQLYTWAMKKFGPRHSSICTTRLYTSTPTTYL